MSRLSIRLSEDLKQRLDAEARREGIARSEVARVAIAEYLTRRERGRLVADFVAEARTACTDPAVRSHALALASEVDRVECVAAETAERRARQRAITGRRRPQRS